jgi:hypothetical protein
MGWETITPRAGVRSQSGGITCAWRAKQRRLAVTIGAEACRRLGIKSGLKEPVLAQMDLAQGLLRLTFGREGHWTPRPKDGCTSIHLPMDHLTDALPVKPAQTAAFTIDERDRSVTVTLPAWAAPGAAAARAAAASVRRVA